MQLIVTVHVREGDERVARRMAVAAEMTGAGRLVTRWVDETRTAFRAQFDMADHARAESLDALAERFTLAAGPDFVQLIMVASTAVGEAAPTDPVQPNRTFVLKAPITEEPAADAREAETPREVAPIAVKETETPREVAPVAPARPRPVSADGSAPAAFFVRSATTDGLHGIMLDSGQELAIQPNTRWDVVDGEVLLFRPKKFWRFARSALASGEFVASRLEPEAAGLPPLRLLHRGNARYELERVDLEGDPDDPADDPIVDARAALEDGDIPGCRAICRGALREDVRALDAHALLAETAARRGDPDQAARHDAVLLAFARLAIPADFSGTIDPELAGNGPVVAAISRDHSRASAAAHERLDPLVAEWRRILRR